MSPNDRFPQSVLDLPHTTTVYATFGTVFADAGVLRTMIHAVQDLDVNLVVTTGHGVDPNSLGVAAGARGCSAIPPAVPAAAKMQRGRVARRFRNGVGALAQRLPQVCVPVGADQFVNAERIARYGAGIVLSPDARTPQAVRAALLSVLQDPSFASAATRLQSEVERMPPADALLSTLLAGK